MKWLCCLLMAAGVLPAQSQSFDTYSYDAPPGYTARTHKEAVEWSKIDQKRRFYCQIGLYRAQNSLGSTARDLDNEWQAVVVKQFRVQGASTSKDIPLPNAPTSAVRGSEAVDGNGNKVITTLFVVRFDGRYVGVLYNAPTPEAFQTCQEDITRVVGSIRITAAPSAPTPTAAPGPSTPSSVPAPMPGTIVGTWEKVITSRPAMTYNMFTKQMEYNAAAAMMQFRQVHRYRFEANGTYTYDLIADDFNRSQRSRVLETGAYTISGGTVQLQPRDYRDGKGPKGQDPPLSAKTVPAPRARRFLIGEHPQYKDSAGLQLQNAEGAFETFKPIR